MRVYLIAAPEDEAEAEKLADYLKRFGVFIRTEYGRMAYPPAHHGEYTLALWSRNAMMSSRQMMLTNRAIDAWEDGQLIMARLEPGLSPRGLADLNMVDLTFAAAREHRYHDVLNAIRAMDDQRRAAQQAEEEERLRQAELRDMVDLETTSSRRDLSLTSKTASGALDVSQVEELHEDVIADVLEQARAAESASPAPEAKAKSSRKRGWPTFALILVVMSLISAGAFFTYERFYNQPPPLTEEQVLMLDLSKARGEIRELEAQIFSEKNTLDRLRQEQMVNGGEDDFSDREAKIAELDQQLVVALEAELSLARRVGAPSLSDPDDGRRGEMPAITSPRDFIWPAIFGFGGLGMLLLFIWTLRRGGKRKLARVATAESPVPVPETVAEPAPVEPRPSVSPSDGHDAFVSYSHQNAETVLPIVESIEERGVSVWIDRDEMQAGQTWAGQIVRAIKAADRFCIMCSAQAFESDHVRREVYLADKYGKTMVPIRLDASEMPEDIEYFLIGRQWVDVFGLNEKDRKQAIQAILSNLEN